MNPSAQVHLSCSHIPELLLPVHCLPKLQKPPKGTLSEMINSEDLMLKKAKGRK